MKASLFVLSLFVASNAFAVATLECTSLDRNYEMTVHLVEGNDSASLANHLVMTKTPTSAFFSSENMIQPKLGRTFALTRMSARDSEYRRLSWKSSLSGKQILLQIHEPMGQIQKRTSGYLHLSNSRLAGSLQVMILTCNRK